MALEDWVEKDINSWKIGLHPNNDLPLVVQPVVADTGAAAAFTMRADLWDGLETIHADLIDQLELYNHDDKISLITKAIHDGEIEEAIVCFKVFGASLLLSSFADGVSILDSLDNTCRLGDHGDNGSHLKRLAVELWIDMSTWAIEGKDFFKSVLSTQVELVKDSNDEAADAIETFSSTISLVVLSVPTWAVEEYYKWLNGMIDVDPE